MFLITTADQRFWKGDEPVLFLGEWCRLYEQKEVWAKLKHTVLPYHWDDREKLYQDYKYLKTVYERYLTSLVRQLNQLHSVNHSVRYWRIIIGPWLHYFIAIIFDRYSSLKKAYNTFKIDNTIILKSCLYKWTPRDMDNFNSFFVGDIFNQVIFSEIIRHLHLFPYEEIEIENDEVAVNKFDNIVNLSLRSKIKSYVRNLLIEACQIRNPSYVFVASNMGMNQAWLEVNLGQIPSVFDEIKISPLKADEELRRAFVLNEGNDEFEGILDILIPKLIPVAYIENYKKILKQSFLNYTKSPKVIFTSNACIYNEGFKIWTAENIECGAKLINGQHGGHYGTGLWNWQEEHEINISDKYFTWGWKSQDEPKVKPLPAAKYNTIKSKLNPDPEGYILWTWVGLSRYSYWMYSVPVASQMLGYFEDQVNFLNCLSSDARELVLIRYKPDSDFGWGQAKRLKDLKIDIRDYDGKESLEKQLMKSRLFVGTYNATTFLETFVSNFPSILFWNPRHWELRRSAIPFFNELKRVGILFDSPEDAARKVNEIYLDPIKWWRTTEIQDVKNKFCEEFVNSSSDWVKQWKAMLTGN